MLATFTVVRNVLVAGGRFVFNVGAGLGGHFVIPASNALAAM